MTNFKKIAVLGTAAVALVATPAAAQQATNSNGKAKARVIKPLTLDIVGNDELDFGTIVLGTTGTATVSIAASAAGTTTNGGDCGANGFVCSGAVAASINYNMTGTQGQDVDVDVPATATITHTNGTDTLTVDLTTSLSDSDSDAFYDVVMPNSGAAGFDFYVGGSLDVASTTLDGEYNGTFTVTADYQ